VCAGEAKNDARENSKNGFGKEREMIRPDEAILILKGWLDSRAELLLTAKMTNFSMLSKCHVAAVEEDTVTLRPVKDDAADFRLSLDSEHLELRYLRIREFTDKLGLEPVPEEKLDNSALFISLPLKAVDPTNTRNVSIQTIILQEL
jgi:hypothetical protein